jgi:signal transduction histidine kinase
MAKPHPSVTQSRVDVEDASVGVHPGLQGTFDAPHDIPAQLTTQAAQLHELRAETERLRAERDRLLDRQRQLAELLSSTNPEKMVHDLRNLLNELQLYKMLAETTQAP